MLQASGIDFGDASRCCAPTAPSSSRSSQAANRSGLRLTPINWHLTGGRGGVRRRGLRRQGVLRRCPVRRRCTGCGRRGEADARAVDRRRDRGVHRPRGAARRLLNRRPAGCPARHGDDVHLGHDRPAQGRAARDHRHDERRPRWRRPSGCVTPRASARQGRLADHRPALPRGSAAVRTQHAAGVRYDGRADGWLGRRADARSSSSSTRSPTCTWCRRCSTGCCRCRPKYGRATTSPRCGRSGTAQRHARSRSEAGDDRVAGPDRLGVLRRDRGTGARSSTRTSGSPGRALSAARRRVGAVCRRRRRPRVPAGSGTSTSRRLPLDASATTVTETKTAERLPRATYYTTSATSDFSTPTGGCFSPTEAANLIISGGVNIYPAEIESVLTHSPVRRRCRRHRRTERGMGRGGQGSRRGAARTTGDDELAAELITFARERMAGYKVPRSVDLLSGCRGRTTASSTSARSGMRIGRPTNRSDDARFGR